MIRVLAIVGARPQFIKHAPILLSAKNSFPGLKISTLHTGQHYDHNMSQVFFDQLKMPRPEYKLEFGSLSHGAQTGRMTEAIEKILMNHAFDGVLVYGDTNSTLAGALAASKLNVPVFHIEAGLRSFNKSMPEEINRILTDHISVLLFAPTKAAIKNLHSEGINKGVIETGDIMYDMLNIALDSGVVQRKENYRQFYLCTIHRPYNTDDQTRLLEILFNLNELDLKVIFPIHPRTKNLLSKSKINLKSFQNIHFIDPVSYFDNLNYIFNSSGVITDSGGMQKEAYMLKKKCITIRPETEWIETLTNGWNHLVFNELTAIGKLIKYEATDHNSGLYGDGQSATSILHKIESHCK